MSRHTADSEVLTIFTMDVEPVTSADGHTSGPATATEGAQRAREYADVLGDFGYCPTYFIHPEMAELQAELFLELHDRGAGLGLHLHPPKFSEMPSQHELGGLTKDRQLEVISAALAIFERHFGFHPRIFRPGCFSGNDSTFSALHELGFDGGSISIPGRIWLERYCVWAGAEPHPHLVNAEFRQLPGQLPFVDIPLSVDRLGGLHSHPLGFQHYPDLRPGGVYSEEEDSGRDHLELLQHIIQQLAEDEPKLKTIVIDVHNDRSFSDPAKTSARQLRTILDNLKPELERFRLHPVSATIGDAIERFNEINRESE